MGIDIHNLAGNSICFEYTRAQWGLMDTGYLNRKVQGGKMGGMLGFCRAGDGDLHVEICSLGSWIVFNSRT